MNNVVAYNVSVHATNLKNKEKVRQAFQFLLHTSIDLCDFEKFQIRRLAEKYLSNKEFSEKAHKLICHIDRLERSQTMCKVLTSLDELELDEHVSLDGEDDLLDEEVRQMMGYGGSDQEFSGDGDDDEEEERPVLKLYTEQCEDSPRHQSERVSLWNKIASLSGGGRRTPSPSPSTIKKTFETPRYCPISRPIRGLPMRDRNRKELK